jgi:hypothetical protein
MLVAKRRVKARVANDARSPVMASLFSPENYTADFSTLALYGRPYVSPALGGDRSK